MRQAKTKGGRRPRGVLKGGCENQMDDSNKCFIGCPVEEEEGREGVKQMSSRQQPRAAECTTGRSQKQRQSPRN